MGYYTIRLDPDASRICTINFPWGKYSYKWLPMDIAGSPDIFKTKMSELMRTLDQSEDDLLTKYQVTKASLSDHLDKLKKVLTRLREAGFKQRR